LARDFAVEQIAEGTRSKAGHTVDTWSERLSAAENAFEGGAIKVINRLDVSFGPRMQHAGV
jgi:hypothetical protein